MKIVITKNTTKKNKIKALNTMLSDFFCAVVPSHITHDRLTKDQLELFKRQAQGILSTDVWKWLKLEMEEEARKKMFNEALTPDDMLFGKAMIYALDVLHNKMINLVR